MIQTEQLFHVKQTQFENGTLKSLLLIWWTPPESLRMNTHIYVLSIWPSALLFLAILQLLLWSLASSRLDYLVFSLPESVAEYVLNNLVGERPHRKAGKSFLYSKHQFLSKHSTVIKMISTAFSSFPFITEYQHIILKSLLFIHKGLLFLVSTYIFFTWTLNSTNTEARHWWDLICSNCSFALVIWGCINWMNTTDTHLSALSLYS